MILYHLSRLLRQQIIVVLNVTDKRNTNIQMKRSGGRSKILCVPNVYYIKTNFIHQTIEVSVVPTAIQRNMQSFLIRESLEWSRNTIVLIVMVVMRNLQSIILKRLSLNICLLYTSPSP